MPTKKEFQVNDIVIGNELNTYSITKTGVKCKVVELGAFDPQATFLLEVIEGENKGAKHWVRSRSFNSFVEPPVSKEVTIRNPKYVIEEDRNLNTTFIQVGDVTFAIPVSKDNIFVSVKHPDDVSCPEIGKAMAFYRLAKGVKS